MSVFTNDVTVEPGTAPIAVDGSGFTQPVSGTVTANAGTGTFTVDGSGVTQPISGTVTANAGTGTFTVDGSGVTQPVSGTIAVSSVGGSVAVTGPLTDTQLRATPVPVSGTFTSGSTGTATVTSVSVGNGAAVTLSASNSAKQGVIIYNEGGTLFVKLGTTASSTSYSYTLTTNSTLEIPSQYYGIVTARKNSGTTNVLVTEIGI